MAFPNAIKESPANAGHAAPLAIPGHVASETSVAPLAEQPTASADRPGKKPRMSVESCTAAIMAGMHERDAEKALEAKAKAKAKGKAKAKEEAGAAAKPKAKAKGKAKEDEAKEKAGAPAKPKAKVKEEAGAAAKLKAKAKAKGGHQTMHHRYQTSRGNETTMFQHRCRCLAIRGVVGYGWVFL